MVIVIIYLITIILSYLASRKYFIGVRIKPKIEDLIFIFVPLLNLATVSIVYDVFYKDKLNRKLKFRRVKLDKTKILNKIFLIK